ncbi:MAG TPA: NAD(+) synthase [Thermomicrobiaceae bacterium]|nr:NAD(+) synthase [Thermomicrobiaceae bacterium]
MDVRTLEALGDTPQPLQPEPFHRGVLTIDAAAETARIIEYLRGSVLQKLGRRGAVVGVSGGVDSSVTLALAALAFGPERVVPLLLQEKESSPDNAVLVRELCRRLDLEPRVEEITGALEGFGCYRRRDEAIRRVFPEFDSTYRAKITLPGDLLNHDALTLFALTIVSPEGEAHSRRLPPAECREIVAATNFKQRTRMALLYHHAELRHYAVLGTANRNERMQGFFVKYGDGAADIDTIVHLYKTQVYQMAEHLGIPEGIQRRLPTTDTYSAPTTEEEFFFRMSFETMDLLWYAQEHGVAIEEAAAVMNLAPRQVERAYREFRRKHRATSYLRAPILALDERSRGRAEQPGWSTRG